MTVLWELFLSFFQVGLLSFGGGMVAISLIQEQVVKLHSWITMSEFADLISIAEMTPGPIAINSATFVGLRVAGIPGALIATFACILPSCIIVSILAWLYFRYKNLRVMQGILGGIRPVIVSLIASAGLAILLLALFGSEPIRGMRSLDIASTVLFLLAFLLLRIKKPQPILVMLGCGLAGIVISFIL